MALDDAPPDPKKAIGSTFSAAAASYDRVIDFFGPFGRAVVAAAAPTRGDRVLDLACGRGACLLPALDAVGPTGSVTGVDLAAGMVDALRADLAEAGYANATVQVGDAEHLDLADGTFDVVTGGFMIFFVPDPPKALAEIRRVLRPGGRVALSVFDGPPGFPWIRDLSAELVGPAEPRPSEAFVRTEVLEAALADQGFLVGPSVPVVERFTFADLTVVEAWMRSHAGRLLLDGLDDAQLAHFRARATELLDAGHACDEGYELVQSARISVATVPG